LTLQISQQCDDLTISILLRLRSMTYNEANGGFVHSYKGSIDSFQPTFGGTSQLEVWGTQGENAVESASKQLLLSPFLRLKIVVHKHWIYCISSPRDGLAIFNSSWSCDLNREKSTNEAIHAIRTLIRYEETDYQYLEIVWFGKVMKWAFLFRMELKNQIFLRNPTSMSLKSHFFCKTVEGESMEKQYTCNQMNHRCDENFLREDYFVVNFSAARLRQERVYQNYHYFRFRFRKS
jgi:hypothetical protein